METLIFLLPMFQTGLGISIMATTIFFIAGALLVAVGYNRDEQKYITTGKKLFKYLIISVVGIILFSPLANIKDSYVNLVAYRAINSDSADKVIRNANLLLDTLGAKLEGLGE